MRLGRILAAVAVLFCLASRSTAGTIRADRSPSLYLNYAKLPRFDSVGLLTTTTATKDLFGTATLISPSVILTAAHLLDDAESIKFTIGGVTYSGAKWLAHPNWTGDLAAGWDIGVLQLSAPVANVVPAMRYTGNKEIGQTGSYVGFGQTGTGLSGATTRDKQKRAGTNIIDGYYTTATKNTRILMADFDDPLDRSASSLGSVVPTNLEFLIAAGDSGGGLFINTSQGYRLAGVHTFGSAIDGINNADYGDLAGDTKVSAFNSWIDSAIRGFTPTRRTLFSARSTLLRGLEDEVWLDEEPWLDDEQWLSDGPILAALVVPEPASAALALAGAALLALFAARRRRWA